MWTFHARLLPVQKMHSRLTRDSNTVPQIRTCPLYDPSLVYSRPLPIKPPSSSSNMEWRKIKQHWVTNVILDLFYCLFKLIASA